MVKGQFTTTNGDVFERSSTGAITVDDNTFAQIITIDALMDSLNRAAERIK